MKSIKKILITNKYVEKPPKRIPANMSKINWSTETLKTVEINRTGQFIFAKTKIGDMIKFETKLTLPLSVSDLVEALANIINKADWKDFEKKEPSAEDQMCKVLIEYYNAEPIEFETKYIQETMPDNWLEFAETINEWVHGFGGKSILDVNGFFRHLKDGEVVYLSCCFNKNGYGQTYIYKTMNDLICEGDEVIVPFGAENHQTRAWVLTRKISNVNQDSVEEIIRLVDDEDK